MATANGSERLAVVLWVAEREERAAAVRVEQAQQQLQLQRRQLAQVREYSRDYRERINGQRGGVPIQDVIAYRQFFQRLARVEDDQEKTVMRLQQNLEHLQQLWRQKYQRKKSLENLIDAARRRESRERDRREQRELDERHRPDRWI